MSYRPDQLRRLFRARPGKMPKPLRGRASIPIIVVALLSMLATVLVGCTPAPRSAATLNPPPSRQHDFTYVAIGASDAFGVGTDDPDRDNWPTVLAHLMGSDAHLVNLGIPGETVAEARRTELPVALDARPALVTVWLGVNDIVQSVSIQDYELQLEALLRSIRQHTSARVFVANIPDLSLLSFFAGYDQETLKTIITRWNAAIGQAVNATGASLVNLFADWNELAAHPEYIASDGLHPSTEGARRLAAVFFAQIRPALPALRTAAGTP